MDFLNSQIEQANNRLIEIGLVMFAGRNAEFPQHVDIIGTTRAEGSAFILRNATISSAENYVCGMVRALKIVAAAQGHNKGFVTLEGLP